MAANNNKYNQAVVHGSVELALTEKFITVEGLLEWLSTCNLMDYTIELAYNAVCKRLNPNLHYLNDGVHILAKVPKLAPIAVIYELDPRIKNRKDGDGDELWKYVFETLASTKTSFNVRQRCILLCKGTGNATFLRNNLTLLYGAGFRPEIPGLSNDQINVALLRMDRTDKLRSTGTLAKHMLTRLSYMQQFAPIYYAEVAYKHYYKVALFLHKEKLLSNLTKEDLRIFDNFFESIIDRRLLSYDKLCYSIASMTNDVAGYVLGFPIQTFIPNDEQIHDAIRLLLDKGKDGYCEYIKQLNKSCGLPVGPFTDIHADLVNEQDVFGEDIENYVAFDIVAFRDAKHIYRFTRLEFKQIIQSKKNPYTNDWLPASMINLIKSRVATARELGLPVARTLKEHLDCLENGTFLISEQASQSKPETAFDFPRTMEELMRGLPLGRSYWMEHVLPPINDDEFRWRPPNFDHGDVPDLVDTDQEDALRFDNSVSEMIIRLYPSVMRERDFGDEEDLEDEDEFPEDDVD
jgi:hypothetical protein